MKYWGERREGEALEKGLHVGIFIEIRGRKRLIRRPR